MPVLFWTLRTSADTSLYSRGECLWAPLSLIKTWFVSTSSVCASTIYSKNRLIRSADTSTILGLHTVLISERLVSSPRSTIWIRCASGSMSSRQRLPNPQPTFPKQLYQESISRCQACRQEILHFRLFKCFDTLLGFYQSDDPRVILSCPVNMLEKIFKASPWTHYCACEFIWQPQSIFFVAR